MPSKPSATLVVLREMRDDIRGLRAETNDRFETLEDRFETLETRLAEELTEVAAAVVDVRNLLADRLDQRDRVDDHERRLGALERRAG